MKTTVRNGVRVIVIEEMSAVVEMMDADLKKAGVPAEMNFLRSEIWIAEVLWPSARRVLKANGHI